MPGGHGAARHFFGGMISDGVGVRPNLEFIDGGGQKGSLLAPHPPAGRSCSLRHLPRQPFRAASRMSVEMERLTLKCNRRESGLSITSLQKT